MSEVVAKHAIEYFLEDELLYNISKHSLVPQHVQLSKSEHIEYLKKNSLKENQLPRMECNDPVARYYGFQKGRIIKITRVSETSGICNIYRFVT
jgi:DNA-directed RNA polymerase I, II, and III subunit RPABC1